jgi:large subunit ribosomal protein L4e
MKGKVFGIDGTSKSDVTLPKVFETEYKPKLIKRAVMAMQTARLQPKGHDPRAGLKTTALYLGMRGKPTPQRTINTDKARLPRTKNRKYLLYGRVARIPQSVGGRRAHGPKAIKVIAEKINKKERKLALESAIAATISKELVEKRFIVEGSLPVIVDDKFESTDKTQKVIKILEKVGIGKDLANARGKTRRRAGKGKARGRTKKQKKSVLIVSGKNSPLLKASRNLPGVDAVTVNSLNVELLAPGTEAGRLVVWTKSAIEGLENKSVKTVVTKKKEVKAKKATLKETKKVIKVKRKVVRKAKTKKKVKKVEDEE